LSEALTIIPSQRGWSNTEKSAIIIGNESQGIKPEIMDQLDYEVSIPMPGQAESLNAGVAAAVMMYEIAVRKKYSR
jgi:tRNA G18 (ribose-2'-O)-methylase SpoU